MFSFRKLLIRKRKQEVQRVQREKAKDAAETPEASVGNLRLILGCVFHHIFVCVFHLLSDFLSETLVYFYSCFFFHISCRLTCFFFWSPIWFRCRRPLARETKEPGSGASRCLARRCSRVNHRRSSAVFLFPESCVLHRFFFLFFVLLPFISQARRRSARVRSGRQAQEN